MTCIPGQLVRIWCGYYVKCCSGWEWSGLIINIIASKGEVKEEV